MNYSALGLGPLLRASLRRKFTSCLVVMQIAITMAIVNNALHLVYERYQLVHRDSGLDEDNSFFFTSSGFTQSFNPGATIQQDLLTIRAIPGVVSAVHSNSFPLIDGGDWVDLQRQAGEHAKTPTAVYRVDEHAIASFDLALVAGQNFSPQEVIWQDESAGNWPAQVILTRAAAINLSSIQDWQQLVGKTIYVDINQPLVVKGIVDKLQAPWVEWPHVDNSMLVPAIVTNQSARYFVRTKRGYLPQLMNDIPTLLANGNKQRAIRNLHSIAQARDSIYGADRAVIGILLIFTVVLALITAMGIAGLASFNVNKRRKQIGTRRALGASRSDIVGHFMLENLLLSGMGVILGALLTLGLNVQLVTQYALPAISWHYIPVGMLLLILVGQTSVLWPAIKASHISPAVATRMT
jgi:putative ABC transport system permease protein